jgi:hypothetical protein
MCEQLAATSPNPSEMVIEAEEEDKLRSKYPMLTNNRSGVGSMLLQKRLNKGHRFFDSGDYNMAMAKYKMKGAQQAPSSNLPSQSEETHVQQHDSMIVTTFAPTNVSQPAPPIQVISDGTADTCTTFVEETHVTPSVVLRGTHHQQHEGSVSTGISSTNNHRHSVIPEVHPVEGAAALILQEATGDTIPTPDNVPAVVRKKSLLAAEEIHLYQQHQRHIEQQAEAVKLLEKQLHQPTSTE